MLSFSKNHASKITSQDGATMDLKKDSIHFTMDKLSISLPMERLAYPHGVVVYLNDPTRWAMAPQARTQVQGEFADKIKAYVISGLEYLGIRYEIE